MGHNVRIDNFGAKIKLAIHRKDSPIQTDNALLKHLRIRPDYYSRLKKGTRPLSEQVFVAIAAALDVERRCWYDSLHSFGKRLGFSLRQIATITGDTSPGIDFISRIRDPQHIHDLFEQIQGYWESSYYSVSTLEKQQISRDLLIVESVEDDLYIKCRIIDGHFAYIGHCFSIKGGTLYFILEKDRLFNEVIVYVTKLPDRHPPKLNGIILCLSGGVDESVGVSYPCAAKVAFRYLGKDKETIKEFYPGVQETGDVTEYLIAHVCKFVDPISVHSTDRYREVVETINNAISTDAVPLALRMDKA